MKETNTAQMQRKFLDEYSNTLDIRASALAARYGKRTGVAVARNMLKTEKIQKELNALCERKTEHWTALQSNWAAKQPQKRGLQEIQRLKSLL